MRGIALSCCEHCGLLGTTHFVTKFKSPDGLYDVSQNNLDVYQEHYLQHRLRLYAKFLPRLGKFRKTNRLLEVGSGYGYFLKMSSDAGWDSEGVEISSFCCKVTRQRACKVHQGRLQDVGLIPNVYDVIALWDVIEHLTQPDEIIALCQTLLRPGGALLMRTPDARALASTLWPARVAYRHLVYPANTAEHVFHFRPPDLARIVTQCGLRVYETDDVDGWKERVIAGNNGWVRAGRRWIMRYAQWRAWPYEFVLISTK